jgi:hypothetical protein
MADVSEHYRFHLQMQVILHRPAFEDGTDSVPKRRLHHSDAGETPKRKHITFNAQRKLEIKKNSLLLEHYHNLLSVQHKDYRLANTRDHSYGLVKETPRHCLTKPHTQT